VKANREWFKITDQGEDRILLLDVQIAIVKQATMPNVTVTMVGRHA
jgi:hypothetical protein